MHALQRKLPQQSLLSTLLGFIRLPTPPPHHCSDPRPRVTSLFQHPVPAPPASAVVAGIHSSLRMRSLLSLLGVEASAVVDQNTDGAETAPAGAPEDDKMNDNDGHAVSTGAPAQRKHAAAIETELEGMKASRRG